MIYAAIVEDDDIHANHLKMLLLQCTNSNIEIDIYIYKNGSMLLDCNDIDLIMKFDIIFLDIALGVMDGITIAEKLRSKEYKKTIVFTTNYQSRAIDGYKVNAYRYFLKPLELRDIKDCINYICNKNAGDYFQYTYHGTTGRIAFDDIICFESMQHYTYIITTNKTIKIKCLLKVIKEKCPLYFIRCQRSYIVNSNYIKERVANQLILSNNKVITISSLHLKTIIDYMKEKS